MCVYLTSITNTNTNNKIPWVASQPASNFTSRYEGAWLGTQTSPTSPWGTFITETS